VELGVLAVGGMRRTVETSEARDAMLERYGDEDGQ
jgi:hypothetical protein